MAMDATSNRRLRLSFKDGTILSKTQKKLGLRRSWLLLKHHHHTISDVILDILEAFNLRESCPHGIVLTMDGFVLPPFESTIILKDKDLVSVKRKVLSTKPISEARPFLEDEIVEKQPLPSGARLLANEEFDKENGGYECEIDVGEFEEEEPVQSARGGDVASKKRKASSPIESSKKKKSRQIIPQSVQKKDINHTQNIKTPQKKRKLVSGSNGDVNSEPRFNELEGKQEVTVHASGVSDGAKKVSRGTRRKKMKRYMKKINGTNNNEQQDEKLDEKQYSVKKLDKVSGFEKSVDTNIRQLAEEDNDVDDDLVPVEIRPGHIRFTPASKAKDVQKGQEANGWGVQERQEANCWVVQKNQEENGWAVQSTQKSAWGDHSAQKNVWDASKNKAAKESFCWNGITSKRKGQNWGKQNQPSTWKESRDYNDQSSNSRALKNQPTSSWKQLKDHNTQSSSTWVPRRKQPNDTSMDFEKLLPLIDSPKVGDVIAYRLLELSSSWCPELSSFRVGKVTSFVQETNNIVLVPEAEYPLNLERKADNDQDDDSGKPPQPSVYNEDGSLEIDFPSLVDVRIVKSNNPSHLGATGVRAAIDTPGSSGMSKSTNNVDGSKNGPSNTGNQELQTATTANGKKDVWEEISEALSAKKAQLQQEDTWNKKESSSKRSWSHRTLKGSALGPTMALLRSQNGDVMKP